jgi:hypothetical protein
MAPLAKQSDTGHLGRRPRHLPLFDNDPQAGTALGKTRWALARFRFENSEIDALFPARSIEPDRLKRGMVSPGMGGFAARRACVDDAWFAELPALFTSSHDAGEHAV